MCRQCHVEFDAVFRLEDKPHFSGRFLDSPPDTREKSRNSGSARTSEHVVKTPAMFVLSGQLLTRRERAGTPQAASLTKHSLPCASFPIVPLGRGTLANSCCWLRHFNLFRSHAPIATSAVGIFDLLFGTRGAGPLQQGASQRAGEEQRVISIGVSRRNG